MRLAWVNDQPIRRDPAGPEAIADFLPQPDGLLRVESLTWLRVSAPGGILARDVEATAVVATSCGSGWGLGARRAGNCGCGYQLPQGENRRIPRLNERSPTPIRGPAERLAAARAGRVW